MNRELAEKVSQIALTKTERRIAEYFIENDVTACFMTVAQVAQNISTSETSVIRFARRLGFSGFAEFQGSLQKHLFEYNDGQDGVLSMSNRYKKSAYKKSAMEESTYYLSFFKQLEKNISDIYQYNDDVTFHQVAKAICLARKKYVVGFRGCSGVAVDFARLLRHVVDGVSCVTEEDRTALEKTADIKKEDIIIIFSTPSYGNIAQSISRMAHDTGASICVVTEKILNPVAKNADFVLLTQIHGNSFYHSQVGTRVIAEYLSTLVADSSEESFDERIQRIDHYLPESVD